MKQYNVIQTKFPANPRSKKRRQIAGGAVAASSSAGGGGGGGLPGSGGSVSVDANFDIQNGEGITVTKTEETGLVYTISHGNTSDTVGTGNTDDKFIRNIEIDAFGHVTGFESVRVAANMDDRYLRKDIDDTAHGNITFDKSIGSTIYLDGFDGKGWRINADGTGELEGMRIRSDIYMGGKVGSPSFASGFTGWGWEIDTPTASGTVDNWTVRKSMKVYEMVYSQIYGLNSSFLVSDWNKVKDVSPLGSNRWHITIDKEDNMLMNLREGDIVRMQGREEDSWSIRYFAAQVENVTNETFDLKILEGADVPLPGDHVQRIGNKVDKNRQGLIYFTSSDDYAPYIDILDGVTDQQFREENTKVRIGNLRGIRVNGQPLDMHGIYINGGIFQHSKYYMDDGTTIEQQFSIMDGKLNSTIDAVKKDLSDDPNNILRNATFSVDTAYWETVQDIHFINTPGGYLWLPSDYYVDKARTADIYRDGTRNVLRLKNSSILQPNAVMRVPEHKMIEETDEATGVTTTSKELKTYSFALYYKALTPGTIRAGIAGTELYLEQDLQPAEEYEHLSKIDKWDGEGDFSISYDGEVLIWGVVMAQDRIADAVIDMQTGMEQTAEAIKLWAEKTIKDPMGDVLEEFRGDFKVTAESISAINTHIDKINGTIESSGWINTEKGQELFAKKEMENGDTIVSAINIAPGTIKISANRLDLAGEVTFNMFGQSLKDTINGKPNTYDLGDMAWRDSISMSDLASGLQQVIDGKQTSNQVSTAITTALKGYVTSSTFNDSLNKYEKTGVADSKMQELANALLNGETKVLGGLISTKLIDVENIYAKKLDCVVGKIGGFTIENSKLYSSSVELNNQMIKLVAYADEVETVLTAGNLFDGYGGNLFIKNKIGSNQSAGGVIGWSNGYCIRMVVGNAVVTNFPQRWIDCKQEDGNNGAGFRVEAHLLNDPGLNRTVIQATKMAGKSQLMSTLLSGKTQDWKPLVIDWNSGYIAVNY